MQIAVNDTFNAFVWTSMAEVMEWILIMLSLTAQQGQIERNAS